MEALLDATPNSDSWFAKCVRGSSHIDQAWEARGGGWANDVTQEGWKGFYANLKIAAVNLTEAWKLHPERPYAPFKMITVAMGMSSDDGNSIRLWFQRTIMAQSDYLPAYHQYLFARRPRWGGSHQEMIKLGEECLYTCRFDTTVPEVYLDAIYMSAGDMDNFLWRPAFRAPGVKENLATLFDSLIAVRGEASETVKRKLKLQYAYCMAWAGDYEKAASLLEGIPDDFEAWRGLVNSKMAPAQDIKDLKAEIKLFTGPEKDLAGRWDEALNKIDKKNSKSLAKELLAKLEMPDLKNHILLRTSQMLSGEDSDSWRGNCSKPIFFMLNEKRMPALEFLLENGCSPDQLNDNGRYTAFSLAVARRDFAIADYLLTKGANLRALNSKGESPLATMARFDKPESIEYLLSKGVGIDECKNGGASPLTLAVVERNIQALTYLISKGADVKLHESDNYSPMLYAARNANYECAKILIDANAEIDRRTNDGYTPLLMAVSKGNSKVAKLLIDAGADVNAKNNKGVSALHLAAKLKNAELLKMLLEKNSERGAMDSEGKTPLDYAKAAGIQANIDALSM